MSWHYQIRKQVDKGQAIFEMVEVYLFGHTDGIKPMGDTADELISELRRMLDDAERYPVLVDLPETEEEL